MPPVTRYWSDDARKDRQMSEAFETERRKRFDIYEAACKQYDGVHRKHLKTVKGYDPNVVINLDGQAVDRIIAFMIPKMPSIQFDDDAEVSDIEAEITRLWEKSGGVTLLRDFALFGSLTGHCFARIMPPTMDDDPDPQIIAINPAFMVAAWRAEDIRRVMWYELSYTTDRKYRMDFINLSEFGGSGWQIRTYTIEHSTWKLIATEGWGFPLAPVIDWQHKRDARNFYGKSHMTASGINDSANKIASDVKQILRFHSAPRTIGKGVEADEITETAIEGFYTIPVDGDVKNVEMTSDLRSSLDFFQTMLNAHDAEMRITRLQGSADALKNVTNLGLKVAFHDMLAQNEELRTAYGKGISLITQRLLMWTGEDYFVQPTIKWAMPLPMSDAEETRTVKDQHELGVLSLQSGAERLGLDWEMEQERLQNEGDIEDERMADMMAAAFARSGGGNLPPPNQRQLPPPSQNARTTGGDIG